MSHRTVSNHLSYDQASTLSRGGNQRADDYTQLPILLLSQQYYVDMIQMLEASKGHTHKHINRINP